MEKHYYINREPKDWKEEAALKILDNLLDRRGLRQELEHIDTETREELVSSIAQQLEDLVASWVPTASA
jgi:hypothetical protein